MRPSVTITYDTTTINNTQQRLKRPKLSIVLIAQENFMILRVNVSYARVEKEISFRDPSGSGNDNSQCNEK